MTAVSVDSLATFESTVDILVKEGWDEIQSAMVAPKSTTCNLDRAGGKPSRKDEIARKAEELRLKAEEAFKHSRASEESRGEENDEKESKRTTEWIQQVAKRVEEAKSKLEEEQRKIAKEQEKHRLKTKQRIEEVIRKKQLAEAKSKLEEEQRKIAEEQEKYRLKTKQRIEEVIRKKQLAAATLKNGTHKQKMRERPEPIIEHDQAERLVTLEKVAPSREAVDSREESMEIDLTTFQKTVRFSNDGGENKKSPNSSNVIGQSSGLPKATKTQKMKNRVIQTEENKKQELPLKVQKKAVQYNR
jgi:hypothetical protein